MRKFVVILSLLALVAIRPSADVGAVSVWSSALPIDPSIGVFAVGGSGQLNGEFWVKNGHTRSGPVQVGIRAQERFVGPIEPRGRKYGAEAGNFDGRALWNFDFHLDFGWIPDGSVPDSEVGPIGASLHTIDDFAVYLVADCDPSQKVQPVRVSLDDVWPGAKLVQQSWNMTFDFLEEAICQPQGLSAFPTDEAGRYEFAIEVRERKKEKSRKPGNGNGNGNGKDDDSSDDDSSDDDSSDDNDPNGRDGRVVAQQWIRVIVR